MTCPDKVKLLGFIIPIILSDERDDVWGEWDGGAGTVTLNSKASDDHLRITFLHEILHAMDDILGLGISHRNVYAISQILWLLLKENPALTEWLIANLNSPPSDRSIHSSRTDS